MLREKTREQPSEVPDPSRGARRRSVIGVAAFLFIGLGIWALVAFNPPDRITVAEELADDWVAAWSGSDAQAVAELYSDDAVHAPPLAWGIDAANGRDAILTHAESYVARVSAVTPTGAVSERDDGRFALPVEFVAGGTDWTATIVFTLDGDLASRVEFFGLVDQSLATATGLADAWIDAWSGTDPAAVAVLYSEDAVHVPPIEWAIPAATGRDAVLAHARTYVSGIADVERTGEVRPTDTGGPSYTFPVVFHAGGTTWSALIVVDVDGTQVSRIEFRDLTDIG